MKQCSKCSEWKSLDDYPKRIAKANGNRGRCKSCEAIYKSNLYQRNPDTEKLKRKEHYRSKIEYYREHSRKYYRATCAESNLKRRLKKYGVTKEWIEQAKLAQDDKCAICLKSFEDGKDCAIDHDHETNVVRGLLCDKCNTGLGLFKESEESFLRAIKYLRKYKK